jgi:hypothetical protein
MRAIRGRGSVSMILRIRFYPVLRFHKILILKAFKPVEKACGKIREEFRTQPRLAAQMMRQVSGTDRANVSRT